MTEMVNIATWSLCARERTPPPIEYSGHFRAVKDLLPLAGIETGSSASNTSHAKFCLANIVMIPVL
jgi:hypothetical protein